MASDSTDASRPADSADAPRPLVLHIEISPHLAALCKDVVDTYLGRGASNGGLLKAVLLEGVAVVTAVLKAREAKAEEEKEEEETSEEAEMTDLPPTGLPPAACCSSRCKTRNSASGARQSTLR